MKPDRKLTRGGGKTQGPADQERVALARKLEAEWNKAEFPESRPPEGDPSKPRKGPRPST